MELRPADIAKECGVSVSTVRNWCSEYAFILSPGANPSDGNRVLNERDLEICRYIVTLRKEGMSKPQITLRLRETSFGHIDVEKPIDNPIVELQSLQESPQQPQTSLESTAMTVVPQDYLGALERRFEAMEVAIKENKRVEHKLLRDAVFMFMAGAVVALLIVLIVIVAVDLWAK